MKRNLYLLISIFLIGCSTINVPPYIQDKHPYTKTLLSNYNKTLLTTKKVLEDEGWKITKNVDPATYEKVREIDYPGAKQTLIFAQTVHKSWVGTGKYAQMNIYLRTVDEANTEIEIRYLVVKDAFIKSFYQYRNDKLVDNLIEKINQQLKK
jgi:hypothetical protein